MAGLKLIVPVANIVVDFWKALDVAPLPVPSNEWYTSLQTHLADGAESPLLTFETFKLFEVQRYLALTNHAWGSYWFVGNLSAWNAPGQDLPAIVTRRRGEGNSLRILATP